MSECPQCLVVVSDAFLRDVLRPLVAADPDKGDIANRESEIISDESVAQNSDSVAEEAPTLTRAA